MERTMRDEWYPQRKRTPSFSSALLDTIYRSIDESKSNLDMDPLMGLFKESTQTPKQSNFSHNREKMNRRKAGMIEDWMEKQTSHNSNQFVISASTSSETDTTHKPKQKQRPKTEKNQQQYQRKPKSEGGGFARTKLRALKPISPGSRIASFLSSIFNTGNVKKPKMCYVGAVEDVRFEHKSKSPCFSSSTSSFSRKSCMSKTPSSSSTKGKRSVRFYPVSVILGEDSQFTRESCIKEVKKKNYGVAKENGFMKGCKNYCEGNQFGFSGFSDNGGDDDDAFSYSSSDLFELDHIIGSGRRYQEELPVYETTNLETNKAIANGLRL